jgi:hypothetical protein
VDEKVTWGRRRKSNPLQEPKRRSCRASCCVPVPINPFEQGGGSQASLHHFPADKKNFERIDKREPLTGPLSAWPIAALLLVLLYLVFGLMEHWLVWKMLFLGAAAVLMAGLMIRRRVKPVGIALISVGAAFSVMFILFVVPPILGAIVFWGAILEDAYAVNKRVFFGAAVAVVAFQPVRARLQRVAMDPRVGGIAAALGGGCWIVKAGAILATAPGRPIPLAGPAHRSKGLERPPHFFARDRHIDALVVAVERIDDGVHDGGWGRDATRFSRPLDAQRDVGIGSDALAEDYVRDLGEGRK